MSQPLTEFRHLMPGDAGAVKQLADTAFGSGYLDATEIAANVRHEGFAHVAVDNARVVAFSIGQFGRGEELARLLLSGQDWFAHRYWGRQIALRRHLAVHPDFSGQGIARGLVQWSFNELEQHTPEFIVSVVWAESAAASLGKLLRGLGATTTHTIPKYWQHDSLTRRYDCPICGSPPCSCSAMVFEKNLR